MNIFLVGLLSLLLLTWNISEAKNLGTYGAVYFITETDLVEFIKTQLKAWEASGRLQEEEKAIQERVMQSARRPAAVDFLTTTTMPHAFNYTPTLTLMQSIVDATGRILYPKGTTVNALDTVTFHSTWLFFNADDPRQVRWAIAESKKHSVVKFILISGDVFLTSKTLGRVYFDSQGNLSKKLGLQHIPCAVYQERDHLHIQEFSVGDA